MLADGCEARVRAERPTNEEELRQVIQEVIDDRIERRELIDTKLTLRDLSVIVESFTTTLRGIYHPAGEISQAGNHTAGRPHPTHGGTSR